MNEQAFAGASIFPARETQALREAWTPARRLASLIGHPDTETVEQLCQAMGMSQARLLRFCQAELGCSPKRLIRRARFTRMLRIMASRSYAEWRDFMDPRYVDQSHFIRDFQYFLGMTPSAFDQLEEALRETLTVKVAAPLML